MRSFWSDPFLWIHLSGIAAIPILLETVLVGLAIGKPILPDWIELILIGIIGILPILLMQWLRPFDIFSVVMLAIKPEKLNLQQRRILRMFKSPVNRIIAVIVAVVLAVILWQLYRIAPLAFFAVSWLPQYRSLGLVIACLAFLASNLFLQIPVSVMAVMLTSEAKYLATEPYAVEAIRQDFTILGWQVNQILPASVIGYEIKADNSVQVTNLTNSSANSDN